ncbi:MAG: type II toxin-antitoxin system RelE/ParE family toxin [Candidatus Hydrogenedentes bacterium]|nr:type II toxin-antitoxin system RelE/ParE family toxin [Candidatus Hydrogenedentota bacterium]
MSCAFFETPRFTRRVVELLNDEAYRRLQNDLQKNPTKGDVIPGCGGIRKVRIENPGRDKGKRGGFRVIYLHLPAAQRIYFVAIYSKDEQDNLTDEQKKVLKAIAEQTRETWRQKLRKERA